MAATLQDGGEVRVDIVPDMTRLKEAMRKTTEAFRKLNGNIEAYRKLAEAFGALETWTKATARERRGQRRADAVKRQERYDATPTFDKLAAISERRGASARERERLLTWALA